MRWLLTMIINKWLTFWSKIYWNWLSNCSMLIYISIDYDRRFKKSDWELIEFLASECQQMNWQRFYYVRSMKTLLSSWAWWILETDWKIFINFTYYLTGFALIFLLIFDWFLPLDFLLDFSAYHLLKAGGMCWDNAVLCFKYATCLIRQLSV